MADQTNIQSSASKSIRPFRSSEEYLYAMKEDLAEWLNALYDLDITADTFMESLETGCALCRHANNVNRAAHDFQRSCPDAAKSLRMPGKDVVFQSRNVVPGSFLARDNVSNFISWCRQELWIKDVLMFETNDLVERCNEKNLVLCLLEVARRGSKFGMLAPMLIQLEEEIEEEIRDEESQSESLREHSPPSRTFGRQKSTGDSDSELVESWQQQKRVLCDMRNLDELVREILGQCSCPAQFPMTKVSEGKYKVGDSSALIFIRVLRTHVMVRVGGGWDTLEHYLDKHDPCRCNAFAHRFQQTRSSDRTPHSKSSSAHSSRSASPGPYWRSETMAPYKGSERRSLEPSAPSSSSRPGRAPHGPVSGDGEANVTKSAGALLPRRPRDRSEPRHFNAIKNKDSLLPLTRRLSGDSDSSTASSKGGGVGPAGGGGRFSLGARRSNGEEVILLVNRKAGKHVIERPGEVTALSPPPGRARSVSRERPGPPASRPGVLTPSPPQGFVERPRSAQGPERGRTPALDGPRRLQGPRSLSQGKMPLRGCASEAGPGSPHHRDAPPSAPDRRDDQRPKQAVPGSPRLGTAISRRQVASSASSSPIKGGSAGSPTKKGVVTPRPPAPRSPSGGSRRLLPPISQPGRRSPHSSPRSHHHPPRSPHTTHSPRSTGRAQRGWVQQLHHPQEDVGLGFGFQSLPTLDTQREMELYRSFEAEFLANTQQGQAGTGRMKLPVSQQGFGALGTPASGDPNVTDSAYSSSNSSSSSVNVGGRVRALPELRESKRVDTRSCALEDPPALLHSQTRSGLPNGSLSEQECWPAPGTLQKLPAISSTREEGEPLRQQNAELPWDTPQQVLGGHGGPHTAELLMDDQQEQLTWGGVAGDVPAEARPPHAPCQHANPSRELPLTEASSSPPPPDDPSCSNSSSESSSMCLSASEGSCTPPRPQSNDVAVLRAKRGQKKADRVPSIYKLKLRPRARPRKDNRPENSPSRIPTPVNYRELQQLPADLSPLHTPPRSPRARAHHASHKVLHQALADLIHAQQRAPSAASRERCFSPEPGLETDAWM
ncbi:hypothetical protein P4O66_012169 [Electrophorus voltai]|uniref:GAR domain-containing protein n=1 Tax=Electrophorus voltai TaxID=2609070 RepID=A0AAD9DT44_9TELE|nr:hypothetical protein P4O66_012169 [Electrophorus voltai]